MMRWAPLRFGAIPRYLILFCVAVLPLPASGQSQEVMVRSTGRMVRVCKPIDLDSNVLFLSSDTDFIVAFNLQNVSDTACVPQPAIGFPMFDPEQSQKVKLFDLCTDCEDRLPNGDYRAHDPVVLNSGEFAHLTYQWKTVAPDAAVTCLPLRALFDPVLVVAPTLFKPVCSEIALSRIYPGEFVPPVPKGQRDADEPRNDEVFVLSSHKPRYYQDEMFTLHVGLVNSAAGPPAGEECPTLFLRERSPDGSTRFDEALPAGFKNCKDFTPGANRHSDWHSGFEVDSGVRSRWSGIGDHSFELFQPVGSAGTIQFVRSNKLTVHIDDPALISHKWLGQAKGIGVDVSLDKGDYKLGEDVPLHIAVENFNAPVPIYAISPLWDPFQAIGVEVRDATGRPLPEDKRFAMETLWSGHGLGPFPFALGEPVFIERSLVRQGWLPNRPGTYAVVVSWCALDGSHAEPGSGLRRNDRFKPYATVQAAATFRIVTESEP